MEPEIRNFNTATAIYVRGTGPYAKSAKDAWGAVCAYAFPAGLVGENSKFIGISHDDPNNTPEDKLRYDACITVDREVQPSAEIGVQDIAGGRYAVFLHKGPYDKLMGVYAEIFEKWRPANDYTLREVPCFEIYLNSPDQTPPEELLTEVCIPIE